MNNKLYKFVVITDGVRLDKYIGNEVDVKVPSTVDNLKVIEINNNCFYKNDNIKSIDFNDTEYISQLAVIGCSNLTHVNFGTRCKKLLYNTITDSPNLSHITMSGSVNYINPYFIVGSNNIQSIVINEPTTFKIIDSLLYNVNENCVVRYIKSNSDTCIIPPRTKKIENCAFFNATNLKRIKFNDELEIVGLNAFENCVLLEDVHLKYNITKIGMRAFANCTSLKSAKIDGIVEQLSSGLFYNCNNLLSFDMQNPNGVKIVSTHVFYNCSKLLKIPNFINANRIMLSALMGAESIKELDYCGISHTGDCFIYDTNVIKNDTCDEINSNINVLYNKMNIKIRDTVTELPSFAFERFNTENIILGKNVSVLNYKLFNMCYSLKNIFVDDDHELYTSCMGILLTKDKSKILFRPFNSKIEFINNIVEIGEWAYQSTTNLITLNNLPTTVKKICIGAFENSSLENVVINNDLDVLESFVFAECKNIKSVKINGKINVFGNAIFKNCINLKELYISPVNKDSTFGNAILENNPNIEIINIPNVSEILTQSINYNQNAKIIYNT